jgi:hypothetical protein
MKWLQGSLTWLASTRDAPVLALLGLVLLTWALGLWWRRAGGPDR